MSINSLRVFAVSLCLVVAGHGVEVCWAQEAPVDDAAKDLTISSLAAAQAQALRAAAAKALAGARVGGGAAVAAVAGASAPPVALAASAVDLRATMVEEVRPWARLVGIYGPGVDRLTAEFETSKGGVIKRSAGQSVLGWSVVGFEAGRVLLKGGKIVKPVFVGDSFDSAADKQSSK